VWKGDPPEKSSLRPIAGGEGNGITRVGRGEREEEDSFLRRGVISSVASLE
jgi:hypothetical protein